MLARSISKLKPGKEVRFKVSLKEHIMKEDKVSVQEKGGELSEVAMMLDLHDMLSSKGVSVSLLGKNGRPMNRSNWVKQVYNVNMGTFRKEGSKNASKWIRNGKAAASEFYRATVQQYGTEEALKLFKFTLEHKGQTGQGDTKSDIDIRVIEKSSSEILQDLKLSMKSTANEIGQYKGQGLQTGEEKFFLSVISGTYSRELDLYGGKKTWNELVDQLTELNRQNADLVKERDGYTKEYNAKAKEINDLYKLFSNDEKLQDFSSNSGWDYEDHELVRMDKALEKLIQFKFKELGAITKKTSAVDKKIAGLAPRIESIENGLPNTLEAQLDDLAKKYKIKVPNNEHESLGVYVRNLAKYIKDFEKWAGSSDNPYRTKKGEASNALPERMRKPYTVSVTTYVDLLEEIVRKAIKDDEVKRDMIKGCLELAGIESGLDYVSMGGKKGTKSKGPDGDFIRVAATTLYNAGYKKQVDRILDNVLNDKFEVEVERKNIRTVVIHLLDNGNRVLKFGLYKDTGNVRIAIPQFKTPDDKYEQLVKIYSDPETWKSFKSPKNRNPKKTRTAKGGNTLPGMGESNPKSSDKVKSFREKEVDVMARKDPRWKEWLKNNKDKVDKWDQSKKSSIKKQLDTLTYDELAKANNL